MGVVQTVLAFNVVLLLALVLHLISTPLSDLIEAAGGYTSKTVCSNYFLSGRNQTYLQKELSEVFGAIASDIHEEEGYVISYLSIVGLEISQYLGMATPIAVYLGPSIGCRLTFAPVNESLALIASFDADKNWDKKGEQYQYKIYGKPHTLSFELAKIAGKGPAKEHAGILWLLTFGLGIIGALLFILPNFVLLGKAGIKNNGIYLEASTNRGFIAWLVLVYLVSFYLVISFQTFHFVLGKQNMINGCIGYELLCCL